MRTSKKAAAAQSAKPHNLIVISRSNREKLILDQAPLKNFINAFAGNFEHDTVQDFVADYLEYCVSNIPEDSSDAIITLENRLVFLRFVKAFFLGLTVRTPGKLEAMDYVAPKYSGDYFEREKIEKHERSMLTLLEKHIELLKKSERRAS